MIFRGFLSSQPRNMDHDLFTGGSPQEIIKCDAWSNNWWDPCCLYWASRPESGRYIQSRAVCFSFFFLFPSVRHIAEKCICRGKIVSLLDKIILHIVHKLCCDNVSPHLRRRRQRREKKTKKHRDWLEKRAPDKWLKRLWSNSVQKMSF